MGTSHHSMCGLAHCYVPVMLQRRMSMYKLMYRVVLWGQICTGSASVAPPQCKSRVCTASNDIAKIGLATLVRDPNASVAKACSPQRWFCGLAAHQIGCVGSQHTKLVQWACSTWLCQLAAHQIVFVGLQGKRSWCTAPLAPAAVRWRSTC